MAYTALYRKYRPFTFQDVVGQDAIVQTLKNQIENNKIAHAYLFCGTRGTGKTSVAKIFARAVNCVHIKEQGPCNECEICTGILKGNIMNMIEIDAASHTGVDDIREIREEVKYPPTQGKYKVYIIDEVHMLSTGAFNALLKTLEEPPPYIIFILATTDPQKIPPTILSRCQRFDFKRISIEDMVKRLKFILNDIGEVVEEEAIYYIAKISDGAMRDALSILDQCLSFHAKDILTLEEVLDVVGAVDQRVFFDLAYAIEKRNIEKCMDIVEEVVMQGRDIKQFILQLVVHFRNLLVVRTVKDPSKVLQFSKENIESYRTQSKEIKGESLLRYIEKLSSLENELKYTTQQRVLVEIALVQLCSPAMDTSNESLLIRIAELEEKIAKGVFVQKETSKEAKEEIKKEIKVQSKSIPKTATDEDINKAMEKWKEIIQSIPNVSVRQYLSQQTPDMDHVGNLNHGILYIRFAGEGVMNIIARDEKKIDSIEEAVLKVTGKNIKVQCIIEKEYHKKYVQIHGEMQKQEKAEDLFDFSMLKEAGIPIEIVEEGS